MAENHEPYPGLFVRLERGVERAQTSLARERGEAATLLRDLLRPRSSVARLTRLHEEPRFHQPALAALLLTEMPPDKEARRERAQLALVILDLAPESAGGFGQRASLRTGAYIALGDALRELGDFAGAEMALLFAPEWVERTGDALDAANLCRTLGCLRRDQERRDEAIALLTRAADLYEEISQSEAEVQTRVELGELTLQAGEPGRALDAFVGALRFGPQGVAYGLAVRAAHGMAECWLLLDGMEAALGSLAGIREAFGWARGSAPSLALSAISRKLRRILVEKEREATRRRESDRQRHSANGSEPAARSPRLFPRRTIRRTRPKRPGEGES